jgi:hypothetical protein
MFMGEFLIWVRNTWARKWAAGGVHKRWECLIVRSEYLFDL